MFVCPTIQCFAFVNVVFLVFLQRLFSSDTMQVLMFVCPTIQYFAFINVVFLVYYKQICLQFCIESYTRIFWLFNFDTTQVLMSICPAIPLLRFYGCCHLCFYTSYPHYNKNHISYKSYINIYYTSVNAPFLWILISLVYTSYSKTFQLQ